METLKLVFAGTPDSGLVEGDLFIPLDNISAQPSYPRQYDPTSIGHKLKWVVASSQPLTSTTFICYHFNGIKRLIFRDIKTGKYLCFNEEHFTSIWGTLSYEQIVDWVKDLPPGVVKSVIGWEPPVEAPKKKTPKWTLGKAGVVYANN